MEVIWLLVALVLSSCSGLLVVAGLVDDLDDQDYVDLEDPCLPQLADKCFKDVMPSFACQLENKGSCDELSDLCSVISDSLQCASDIIDTGCKPKDGLTNFDSWLGGLNAVNSKLCGGDGDFIRALVERPCFNSDEFLDCVKEMTRVTHIVDFLQVALNANECNHLLIALTTCNIRANAAHSRCYMPQEVINEIMYTFFSHTQCGANSCKPGVSHATPLQSSRTQLIVLTLVPLLHEFTSVFRSRFLGH